MISPQRMIALGLCLMICLSLGSIGSISVIEQLPGWYATIQKPVATPQPKVFALVWATIYFSLGIATFKIWDKGLQEDRVQSALLLFLAQLVFNVLWVQIFFVLHWMLFSLLVALLLWLLIFLTTLSFNSISRLATAIMVPYLLWTGFMVYLNLMVVLMN